MAMRLPFHRSTAWVNTLRFSSITLLIRPLQAKVSVAIMSRIQCQSFGSPNPLLAYQNSTSSSITTKNKRQPVSFQKSTTSRLLVSAIRTERKRTNFPTRHQPANIGKRAAKPRSAMVAVSTPGKYLRISLLLSIPSNPIVC